ncbi:MAG: excinuclease ABC subunit UvrA [Saprospiraceae bacterium]|nr:excinuclease ABC subunit UvrA [Saprospiraceae bacterium]
MPSTKKLQETIHVKGARSNNLKDIEVEIPKEKLVVVTGLSGSGKSSLVMDTLYAEGQRRYVESLSSYARQFLVRMKKPDVDFIKGLSPAIAIEQAKGGSNARSTVGSMTEIYDYLRLLFARIGRTFSPVSGEEVRRYQVQDVVDYIMDKKEGAKVHLFVRLASKYADRQVQKEMDLLLQKGFTRVRWKGELVRIEDFLEKESDHLEDKVSYLIDNELEILVDRFVVKKEDTENIKRIADSVQTAFFEGDGELIIDIEGNTTSFNNKFEADGIQFVEPTHQLFNYNNSYGACPKCEGYGRIMGIDEKKVIPREGLSVYEGAIAAWSGEKYGRWLDAFLDVAHKFDFPVHQPYKSLSKAEKKLLWTGNEHFRGIDDFFEELREKTYKIQNRVMLARYRGRTTCPECDGGRLRKEATYVKINGYDITEWIDLPIDELEEIINQLQLTDYEEKVANRILVELKTRLGTMQKVGLDYLTINRLSNTLSGGETQRIHLTRLLGSNLTNSLYILDEPSIGLHPRDTTRLVEVLKALRDLGNTVVVVEHEEEIIRSADYIIDIGPMAGTHGGELVFAGPSDQLIKTSNTLTADYLTGRKEIEVSDIRRSPINKIIIKKAEAHNLQSFDVTFPLNMLVVVTGVSGSGKSTLVRDVFYRSMLKHLGEASTKQIGAHEGLSGDLNAVDQLEYVSQSPIGKSSRSNPVTYVKAYDAIRKLFTKQQLSKIRGYDPKHFSFNVDGGRCETCKGEGEIVVEMQFLADVKLLCDECKGKRFKKEVLDVKYNGKNIFDVLDMTIEEAIEFFEGEKDIYNKIKPLHDVGLGYIKLGQSSSTLSGGEAQRVKLASFLNAGQSIGHVLFIFDEPTTGLHFHDVNKLLYAMNALIENGHSVIVIEHNLDVIKNADWLIDLGPGGGKHGGRLLYEGAPEGILGEKESATAEFLRGKLG